MKLRKIDGLFSIASYPPDANIAALYTREFCAITRTRHDVTVVCESDLLPPGMTKKEDGWVCLAVEGIMDVSLGALFNSLLAAIPSSEISLFAVSTFDTDYILVKRKLLHAAERVLEKAGIYIG